MKLYSISVGKRIGLGFGGVLLLLVLLGVYAYTGQIKSYSGFVEYRALARNSNTAARLQANMLTVRLAVKDFFFTKSDQNIKEYENRRALMLQFLTEARSEIREADQLKLLAGIDAEFRIYDSTFKSLVEVSRQGSANMERENELIKTLNEIGPAIAQNAEDMKLSLKADQDRLGPKVQAESKATVQFVIWVSLSAVVVGIGSAIMITRSISHTLRNSVEQLSAGADQTASAALQVSATSQALAEGASTQAASLEEASASLEETASMAIRNAEAVQKVSDVSRQTRTTAELGAEDMKAMSAAVLDIKISGDEIAKIIKTIDEISFQTNILALNAAVEAARAGEAGMSFGVVAEEVRALAHRSALAAKETAAKIEDSIGKTARGVEISAKVAKALTSIVSEVRQVDDLATEVATSSREQTEGIKQMNVAVSQMDRITQSNAAHAEEAASAAEELTAQADATKEVVFDLTKLVGGTKKRIVVKQNSGDRSFQSEMTTLKMQVPTEFSPKGLL